MKDFRIAVVGCGSIGLRHLFNLTRIANHDIKNAIGKGAFAGLARQVPTDTLSLHIAALDPSANSPADVAAVSGKIQFLPSWEVLKGWRPNIVIVATPNHLHKQNTLDALELGAHVLCEKPIACSSGDARSMAQAAREAKRILAVGQTERFREATATIISMAKGGELGNLVGGRAMVGTYNTLLCAKDKRHRMENFGTIVIDYVHEIDLLHAIFGTAIMAKGFFNSISQKELQASPTLVSAILKYRRQEVVSLHFDYVQHPQRRLLELYGDQRTLVYDFQTDILELWDKDREKPERRSWNNERNDQFVREHLDMISAVMNGTRPQVDAEAAADVLETVELILESLR